MGPSVFETARNALTIITRRFRCCMRRYGSRKPTVSPVEALRVVVLGGSNHRAAKRISVDFFNAFRDRPSSPLGSATQYSSANPEWPHSGWPGQLVRAGLCSFDANLGIVDVNHIDKGLPSEEGRDAAHPEGVLRSFCTTKSEIGHRPLANYILMPHQTLGLFVSRNVTSS